MIGYQGSKRLLIGNILEVAYAQSGGKVNSVLDLFTGTTRVAYAFKQQGVHVWANDYATYSAEFAKAYIQADKNDHDLGILQKKIDHLNVLDGVDGFITQHYSEEARFFQRHNARRIDAIRPEIDKIADNEEERAILITSLLLAADKVDSDVATQRAYLKQWSQRSYNNMELVLPRMLRGKGAASNMEAVEFVQQQDTKPFDIVYIDPPYKTATYFGTYHIWETITRGDQPLLEGVPNKRADWKDHKTGFDSKKTVVQTMDDLFRNIESKYVLMSYSDEGDVSIETITTLLDNVGREVKLFPVQHKRNIMSDLGQNDKNGVKTGKIGTRYDKPVKKSNTEYLIWASQR